MNIIVTINGASVELDRQLSVQYEWSVSGGPEFGASSVVVQSDNYVSKAITDVCVADANAAGFPVGPDDIKILLGNF